MKRSFLFPVVLIVAIAAPLIGWFGFREDDTDSPTEEETTEGDATTNPKPTQTGGTHVRPKPKTARENPINQIFFEDTYENNLVGDLVEPFDGKELRELADQPKGKRDDRRLADLILRATGKKDASFRDLIARDDLRGARHVDIALDAYDYAVTGNIKAIERIIVKHEENVEKGKGSWDSDAVWALGYVDEWDLTLKALQAHPLSGDGSSGPSRYAFWLRRRFLFPRLPDFPKEYYKEFYTLIYGEE